MIIVEHYEAAVWGVEEATRTFESTPVDSRATIIIGERCAARGRAVLLRELRVEIDALGNIRVVDNQSKHGWSGAITKCEIRTRE